MAVLMADGEAHLPVVRLVRLRDDVVGGGEGRRTIERVDERHVLGVQVKVPECGRDDDQPQESGEGRLVGERRVGLPDSSFQT